MLDADLARVSVAVKEATRELGLLVREESDAFLRVSENRLTMSPWANSTTLRISLEATGADATRVTVSAKNIGLGPIQSRHVRTVAETFAARLSEVVRRPR
jgi:hypothetical protein